MKLKMKYATAEEIPSGFESLYAEKGGEWVLVGVEGLESATSSTDALRRSLTAEREAHKATKAKITELETERDTAVTERDELQLRIEGGEGGKLDDKKIEEIVERRVALVKGPLEKKLQAAESRAAEFEGKFNEAVTRERQSSLRTALQEQAAKEGVDPKMMQAAVRLLGPDLDFDEGGNIIAREGGSFTPGIDVSAVLSEAKQLYPNLWPLSKGGDSRGGSTLPDGTPNPFSYQHWNLTKQLSLPQADAERMAKAAGVDIKNPVRPAPPKG